MFKFKEFFFAVTLASLILRSNCYLYEAAEALAQYLPLPDGVPAEENNRLRPRSIQELVAEHFRYVASPNQLSPVKVPTQYYNNNIFQQPAPSALDGIDLSKYSKLYFVINPRVIGKPSNQKAISALIEKILATSRRQSRSAKPDNIKNKDPHHDSIEYIRKQDEAKGYFRTPRPISKKNIYSDED